MDDLKPTLTSRLQRAPWRVIGLVALTVTTFAGACCVWQHQKALRARAKQREELALQEEAPAQPMKEQSSLWGSTQPLYPWQVRLQEDLAAAQKQERWSAKSSGDLSPEVQPLWGPHVVYFKEESAKLTEALPWLQPLTQYLLQNPALQAWVVGYADFLEGKDSLVYEEGVQALSLARAQALADLLQAEGVELHRLRIEGGGVRCPIDFNPGQPSAFNRRAMVVLLAAPPSSLDFNQEGHASKATAVTKA